MPTGDGGIGHTGRVSLFKGRKRGQAGSERKAKAAERAALVEFIATRRGVEAYLEPRTSVTQTTVVLVATDGEWTRKPFDSPKDAADFARKNRIPLYDTNKVGYPDRMRDYSARQAGATKKSEKTAPRRPTQASAASGAATARRSPDQIKAIRELQFVAEADITDGDLDDDALKRLVRAARGKAHPDRSGGDRSSWDRVDRAARLLGLD